MIIKSKPGVIPTEDAVKFGVPVQAATWQAWIENTAYLIGYRMRQSVHHACDYADPKASSPFGEEQVIRTIWTQTPRTRRVWVAVRYQSGTGSPLLGDPPEMVVYLKRITGEDVDAGFTWSNDNIVDTFATGADTTHTLHTTFRAVEGAGATATSPRLLNTAGEDGNTLELWIEATSVRVIDVNIWEVAPVDMPLEPPT